MPFYIKKSVSAGPFRFNFSKGGIGMSVGIKGLRLGTGPRGHYIHAGRGGLYYRASLGRAGERKATKGQFSADNTETVFAPDNVVMKEIESGDVMEMQDSAFSNVLQEINSKYVSTRMASVLFWVPLVAGCVAALSRPELSWIIIFALPGWLCGRWWDTFRRSTVLFYDMDSDVEQNYAKLISGFDDMLTCAGLWHVEAGGAVQDITTWKNNAGATHLVRKKPTILAYKLPLVIKSNIIPPAMHVGRQVLYFLPDIVLVEDKGKMGAVSYTDLRIRYQDSNFIEEGRVPADAQVIRYTWKHPNKSGGPDRRYKVNHQIPICRYEVMHMSSASGLNEMLEFSRTNVARPFAEGVEAMNLRQVELCINQA